MIRAGASTGRPTRRMMTGPGLGCSARPRDSPTARAHHECKVGTMKTASLCQAGWGVLCMCSAFSMAECPFGFSFGCNLL